MLLPFEEARQRERTRSSLSSSSSILLRRSLLLFATRQMLHTGRESASRPGRRANGIFNRCLSALFVFFSFSRFFPTERRDFGTVHNRGGLGLVSEETQAEKKSNLQDVKIKIERFYRVIVVINARTRVVEVTNLCINIRIFYIFVRTNDILC